jgi:predicted transcriptional regulator
VSGADGNRRRRSGKRRRRANEPPREPASAHPFGRSGEIPVVLSQRHLQIVNAIRAEGVLSISEIADAIGISRSLATNAVEELVRLGVVDRRMDPDDRRRRQVRLTAAWLPGRAAGSG